MPRISREDKQRGKEQVLMCVKRHHGLREIEIADIEPHVLTDILRFPHTRGDVPVIIMSIEPDYESFPHTRGDVLC